VDLAVITQVCKTAQEILENLFVLDQIGDVLHLDRERPAQCDGREISLDPIAWIILAPL
jgi:hypothetical protein